MGRPYARNSGIATAVASARIDALTARVERLEARFLGPRDAADVAVLPALARAAAGRGFTAAAVWAHRIVDAELADTLRSADLDNARQLGKLCRRLEGRDIDGLMLQRVGDEREGIRWRIARMRE